MSLAPLTQRSEGQVEGDTSLCEGVDHLRRHLVVDGTQHDRIVNLASATPGEGHECARWAADGRITFLNGALMGGRTQPPGLCSAGALDEDGAVPAYQSWASSPASRKVMQGNRSRDTSPELAVRRLLHAAGLRYRVDYRPEPLLRRTADIVFTKQRVAVFIDGCYWHACPDHGTSARTNADYWSSKLQRNVVRDADTTAQLEAAGWKVLRFWEHENPAAVASAVLDTIRDLPG